MEGENVLATMDKYTNDKKTFSFSSSSLSLSHTTKQCATSPLNPLPSDRIHAHAQQVGEGQPQRSSTHFTVLVSNVLIAKFTATQLNKDVAE